MIRNQNPLLTEGSLNRRLLRDLKSGKIKINDVKDPVLKLKLKKLYLGSLVPRKPANKALKKHAQLIDSDYRRALHDRKLKNIRSLNQIDFEIGDNAILGGVSKMNKASRDVAMKNLKAERNPVRKLVRRLKGEKNKYLEANPSQEKSNLGKIAGVGLAGLAGYGVYSGHGIYKAVKNKKEKKSQHVN